ncbi:MAG TPA: DUF190 domain-containing protein, partial [Candidatus Wallbacteria bacterium]|nr:DUF190 domain-containing protein [Candidatus Wallbacteria bacterium]
MGTAIKYGKMMIYARETEMIDNAPFIDALFSFIARERLSVRAIVLRSGASIDENGKVHNDSVEVMSYGAYYAVTVLGPESDNARILKWLEQIGLNGVITREECSFAYNTFKTDILKSDIKVSEIMSSPADFVYKTALLSEVLMKFFECSVRFLPVLDTDTREVCGIVTEGELIKNHIIPLKLKYLSNDSHVKDFNVHKLIDEIKHNCHIIAFDIMNHEAVTVLESEKLKSAIIKMNNKKLKRVPVVNEEGRLTGVLSRLDIFKQILSDYDEFESKVPKISELKESNKFIDYNFEPVLTSEHIGKILKRISLSEYNFVPVIDKNKTYTGIITDKELFPMAHIKAQGLSLWQKFLSLAFTPGDG